MLKTVGSRSHLDFAKKLRNLGLIKRAMAMTTGFLVRFGQIVFFGTLLWIGLSPKTALAQGVVVSEDPHVNSAGAKLSKRQTLRAERFLQHVFPSRAMRRFAHTAEKPVVRHANYTFVEQDGVKFLVVGYTAWWKQPVNMLAIYRWENAGLNQVWLSNAWNASYYGLNFQTAESGNKALILVSEGGGETSQFELASVFTFQNYPEGLTVRDLTPQLPNLSAHTNFPFRPLYGQRVQLERDTKSIVLTASDGEYNMNMETSVRPTTSWRYSRAAHRFEKIPKPAGAPAWTMDGK